MKLSHLASPALLISFVMAAGCASDPAKKADDAHDQRLEDQRKTEQAQAENRADTRIDSAEMQRKASTANGTPSADAKMTEARKVARAKATERLDKSDARIRELKAKITKAGAKAPTSAADSMRTVDTQRTLVQSHLDGFPGVADDQFENARKSVDTDLDTLDQLIDKSAKQVDTIK